MKKMIIGIVIGVIATIVIGIVAVLLYTKFFMFVPDKGGMENSEGVEFRGMTAKEWALKIAKYEICDVEMVNCYYENTKFIAVVNNENNETVAHYEFEEETGIAQDLISGHKVDFIKGEVVERNLMGGTQIEFADNQVVAIGYIKEDKESEFIDKNFVSKEVLDNLLELDYRKEASREQGIGITFVILPKNSNVEIEIYDCYINEQGEAKIVDKLGETLKEGFILKLDYMAESTLAEICIKVKSDGEEDIIPLVFSGEDGRLYLNGHEKLLDISVY